MQDRTAIDYLKEIGLPGQISIVLFLLGIIFAVAIYVRRLEIRYCAAFLVFSLLPFMVGIFGLSVAIIDAIKALGTSGILNLGKVLSIFGEILQVIPLATLETILLLFLATLLFMRGGRNAGTPSKQAEQDIAPSDR